MTIPSVYTLLLAGGAVLAIGSLGRAGRWMRLSLAAAGAIALVGALPRHRLALVAVAAVLVALNLARLALLLRPRRGAALRDEEARFAERALPRMGSAEARQLLDQGLWIDGRAGELLTREGEPVTHLFYLSEGEAAVASGGHRVATCAAGNFLGEVTVLSGAPATATVTLATHARFWCVTADALGRFLRLNPATRAALEAAFASGMADKLRLANRRLAEGGDRGPT